jgi:predicted KAP-like P-loop ATPase
MEGRQWLRCESSLNIMGKTNDENLRAALEMADRMAPMLAHASRVQGNPRIVKRLLNVVRMRAAIARRRKMPLEESVIAKLALFERCTDLAATESLHDSINAAVGGKPELFTTLEAAGSEEEVKRIAPDAFQKHIPFVIEWARLEPKLAGIDLRPAVYLARETVPLRLAGATLSPKVVRAVETLLQTATISSKAAAEAIASLDGSEKVAAMEQIVGEMRRNPLWEKLRTDFRGSVLLARASPEAAKALARFLRSLPKRPPWMTTMLKDEVWFAD